MNWLLLRFAAEMPMSDLYDTGVLTWSERQAELLRRVAAGEAPNETPDRENVVNELLSEP